MLGVEITSVGDLLNLTLAEFDRNKVAQTLRYTQYALTQLFFLDAKSTAGGGTKAEFRIRTRASESARFVGLYEATPNRQIDVTTVGAEPWSFSEDKVHWDEKESDMNSGEQQIAEIMLERYNAAREGVWNLMEEALPFGPGSATATKSIRGIAYHLRTLGIGEEDPIGDFGGVSYIYPDGSSTDTWCDNNRGVPENNMIRNFAATYDGEMGQVLIDTLRRAMNRTHFRGIPQVKDPYGQGVGRQVLLMDDDHYETYEGIVNRRGVEAAQRDANPVTDPTLRRVEVICCPVLNTIAHRPIYGVNTRHLQGRVLRGRWMRRKAAVNDRNQTDVWTVPIVSSHQLRCTNPRHAGFVLHRRRTA